jgi:sulfur-carrier protein
MSMPRIRFTQNIQRHVGCPERVVHGATLRDALRDYFAGNQPAQGYVLDERGALRKHMAIFINGRPLRDRDTMNDPLNPGDNVDIMQALSGG